VKLTAVLAPMLVLALTTPLSSQHGLAEGGPYDPAIPVPASVLGYELGERFTPHHLIMRYVEAVAAASARVRVDTVAYSHEGREVLLATVTSESNQARLAEIQRAARRLADPRGASSSELAGLVANTPTIVWLGYTVHGNEASGVEAALATLYELAAGTDAQTAMMLDSVVVLIDPVQNPDGHERHVQQVLWNKGAFPSPDPASMDHSQTWHGSRSNHYLFDLNRDWLVHVQPETRGRMEVFTSWYPHVAADLHEMGSNTTYFFAPPMPPVNENVHPLVWKGWDRFSAGNVAAFGTEGLGFFTREGFDEFFPGYGPSWPIMSGAIGMTYEQASSRAGQIRRDDDTILTLREAAQGHYVASLATIRTAALYRTERVGDYLAFRQAAVRDNARAPLRTIAFADDGQGRADALVKVLVRHGIEVGRLTRAVDVRATAFGEASAARVGLPAGSYVVDLSQPQGVLAKALLEPEAALDPAFIEEELERRRVGDRSRFYDLTGWALPYLYRVDAWWTGQAVGPAELVTGGRSTAAGPAGAAGAPLPERAAYGYAFEPGSESSLRLLGGLVTDGVKVRHAPRPFRVQGVNFPNGAFVVVVNRNEADVHDVVRSWASESGARVVAIHNARVEEGADLGSNSVRPIPETKVALVGGDGVSSTSFGAAWHTFDELLRFPVTRIDLSALTRSLDAFTVVVLPSAFGLGSALGDTGRDALRRWVRNGGVLITLDGATSWLASENGLSRLRAREAEPTEDGMGAPLPASVPGAILRARADTLSPLLAGVGQSELPVLMRGSTVYEAPADFRPGEIVVRYVDEDRLRLAGYLWPEVPARVAESPYVWTERMGSGRVIGFADDPNFRGMLRSMLPLFANAVFLGGTF
jgi:hypothetical protein